MGPHPYQVLLLCPVPMFIHLVNHFNPNVDDIPDVGMCKEKATNFMHPCRGCHLVREDFSLWWGTLWVLPRLFLCLYEQRQYFPISLINFTQGLNCVYNNATLLKYLQAKSYRLLGRDYQSLPSVIMCILHFLT